jgi:hypothetical protein
LEENMTEDYGIIMIGGYLSPEHEGEGLIGQSFTSSSAA